MRKRRGKRNGKKAGKSLERVKQWITGQITAERRGHLGAEVYVEGAYSALMK